MVRLTGWSLNMHGQADLTMDAEAGWLGMEKAPAHAWIHRLDEGKGLGLSHPAPGPPGVASDVFIPSICRPPLEEDDDAAIDLDDEDDFGDLDDDEEDDDFGSDDEAFDDDFDDFDDYDEEDEEEEEEF